MSKRQQAKSFILKQLADGAYHPATTVKQKALDELGLPFATTSMARQFLTQVKTEHKDGEWCWVLDLTQLEWKRK